MLELRNVGVRYGAIQAVQNISFTIKKGEIVTLLGANGAGKTTILKAISGILKTNEGEIYYQNELISNLEPHLIVKKRLCQAPEGRGIFLNLSVFENLDLGAWASPFPKKLKEDLDSVFQLFPILKERMHQNAGTLSGGEQQMLAIGRALMAHPELLLLDEPSLGLAPQIIDKIFQIIQKINKEGVTVLLVEQNAQEALRIAHVGVVLETGKIVANATAQELLKSDTIRQAYLGYS